MTARNLAVTLAPVLLRKPFDEHGVPLQDRNEQELTANVLVLLIEGFPVIFPGGCPSITVPQKANRETQREEKIIPPGLSQRFVLNRASDLPEDWQAHVSDEGIPYFYNTLTKESTWIRPLDADDDKQEGKFRITETKTQIRTGATKLKSPKSASAYGSSDHSDSSDEERGRLSTFEESASVIMGDPAISELKRLARAKAMEIRKAKKDLSNLEDKLSKRESSLMVPRNSALKDPPLLQQSSAQLEPAPRASMTPSASYAGNPSFVGGLLSKKPPLPPPGGPQPSRKPRGSAKLAN
jgi:hypothetical protein